MLNYSCNDLFCPAAEEGELTKLFEAQKEVKAMCAEFEEKFDSYMEDMKSTMFEFEK